MIANLLVHDLLKINSAGVSDLCGAASFSSIPLKDFPFVVVRRSPQKDDLIPVGIRGMERHERCAAWLDPKHIVARVTPECIEPCPLLPDRPAFKAFLELKQQWRGTNLMWGPGGSLGFELVSGCHVVREKSDLDLVVRADLRLSPTCLRMLARLGDDLSCAVDVLVETLHGAFSPKEYMGTSARCLLRTIHGPRLVEDPWMPRTNLEQHV